MSDDDDDVVVLRVCANTGCMGIDDLQFDEETGEMYCGKCRALFERAASEGFNILLNSDDVSVVRMIFDAFDKNGKGYWTYQDYNLFQDATEKCHDAPLASSEDLGAHFKKEYDLELTAADAEASVVQLTDLENMYGGYLYNNIPALRDDSETLSDNGFIHLSVLE